MTAGLVMSVQYCLRSICETNLPDGESFFPVGAVAVGLKRADASLGLEEGGWNLCWWGEGRGCWSNCVAGTVSKEVALDEIKVENAVSRRQR